MNFALIGHCFYIIGYYERCCGRLHNSNLPLNLEMINNNHDQEFKTRYTYFTSKLCHIVPNRFIKSDFQFYKGLKSQFVQCITTPGSTKNYCIYGTVHKYMLIVFLLLFEGDQGKIEIILI